MSRVNHLSSLSLLAVLVIAGCSSQAPQPLKKGEKAIDVASVVRQKIPASVKDRDAWAKDLATTFESQGLAPTLETSARCWRWRSRSQIIRQIRPFRA